MKISSEELFGTLHILSSDTLLTPTRIHPLYSWPGNVFLKREDESGFGVSGVKKRKFASLLQYMKSENIQHVAAIGGADSNHITGIIQLLTENRISYTLFLKKSHRSTYTGNRFLIHLLSAQEHIEWVDSEDWERVEEIAETFLIGRNGNTIVIPEGGNMAWSVPGLLSLMEDIIRNEKQAGLHFDHIWIDAGTALSATVLVWVNFLLNRKTHIHVVLMAGDEFFFQNQMRTTQSWLENILDISISKSPPFSLYFPPTAKAFGSTNATILKEVVTMARVEGVLADPIYTAKLFLTARKAMQEGPWNGHSLVIHSGGGTGLLGYSEKIMQFITKNNPMVMDY